MIIEPAPPLADPPLLVLLPGQWETLLYAMLSAPEVLRETEEHLGGLPALLSLPAGAWPRLEWMVRHSDHGDPRRIAPVAGLYADGRPISALAPVDVAAINDPTYLRDYPACWMVTVQVRKRIRAV